MIMTSDAALVFMKKERGEACCTVPERFVTEHLSDDQG